MLQWFIRFPEITKFQFLFRENCSDACYDVTLTYECGHLVALKHMSVGTTNFHKLHLSMVKIYEYSEIGCQLVIAKLGRDVFVQSPLWAKTP